MKIAMAQLGPTTGDLEENCAEVIRNLEKARQLGCDLMVTPETSITGYMSCDLLEVDAYIQHNKDLLIERIVPATTEMAAVVGFVDYDSHKGKVTDRYNAAAVIQDGNILGIARKRCLCRYRFFDETRYFTPGQQTLVQPVIMDDQQVNLAPIICEDLWDEHYDASPYMDAVQGDADLVLVLNASPFEPGKWNHRAQLIQEHQTKHTLPIIYTNTTGIGDNLKGVIPFDGRSMAYDAQGQLVQMGSFFEQELSVVTLNSNLTGQPISSPRWSETEELYKAVTFSLREYCQDCGFEQVVLGMSGGIDSSLCAALAADALGPENVLGVTLPSRHSSSETRSDAQRCCNRLGTDFAELSIEELYSDTIDQFNQWKTIQNSVTRENFQARIRGLLLMGVSNETDRLVIATGNKTELGLGYCTLYGDMVGGMLLIGDINKTQVFDLADHINQKHGRDLIPRSVMERPPTAELAENQTDPFDYPVVAPLIDDLIARYDGQTLMDMFRQRDLKNHYPDDLYERYDEEDFQQLLNNIYHRYRRSAFKRSQSSPILIVSNRALGFDLRETIINKWHPDID